MEQAKIDRINELAAKAKRSPLTEGELAERAALREEFLADFRAGFKAQLEHTYIVGPEGEKRPFMKNPKV